MTIKICHSASENSLHEMTIPCWPTHTNELCNNYLILYAIIPFCSDMPYKHTHTLTHAQAKMLSTQLVNFASLRVCVLGRVDSLKGEHGVGQLMPIRVGVASEYSFAIFVSEIFPSLFGAHACVHARTHACVYTHTRAPTRLTISPEGHPESADSKRIAHEY